MSSNPYLMRVDPTEFSPDVLTNDPSELRFLYTPVTPDGPLAPLNARLLYVRTARYERSWHSSPHTHSFSELFYITGGRGYFMVRGQKCPVARGHLLIVNPLVEHGEFSSDAQPLEYTVLGVEGLQFTPAADTRSDDLPVVHIAQAAAPIGYCMDTLRDEIQFPKPGQEAVCQNLLNIIILMILRQQELHVSISAFNNVSGECLAIKEYINTHFKEPLTLDDLAQEAHQNKYYIAHTFKDAFGISPIKYLMERRVEESKLLLKETDFSIGRIASVIGFSSSSHYSQAFRRIADMTPNEYRKKFRQLPL